MLETQARVMAIETGFAWVESTPQGGCGSCAAKGACGTQLLGEALSSSSKRILAQDPLGVHVGDTVLLGLAEQGALRAAFILYALPMLGLLLGIVLAQPWGDGWAIIAGGAGLGLALLAARLLEQSATRRSPANNLSQAIILARITHAPPEPEALALKTIPIRKA